MTRLFTPAVLKKSTVRERGGMNYINGLVSHALVEACKGHKGLLMLMALDGGVVVYTETQHKWQVCMTAEEALSFDGRIY